MSMRRILAIVVALSALLAACGGAGSPSDGAGGPCFPVKGQCADEATSLDGAGATFPAVIYSKWIEEYGKVTGVQINYQSIGSGGGIKSITDRTVDFGATDGPMSDKQLADAKTSILHVPTVMGAVVPTYNIPGVTQTLKLTPDALAGIFLGQVTRWNDPKIASSNAGVALPDQPITTVHRSDGSGTTSIFTDYLSKVSPEWKAKVGSGTSVNWPGGVGGKGNEGVAGSVKQTPYAIGYVELIYAIQQKLGYASVQNAKGKFVEANLDSVSKAAEGVTLPDDLRVSITNSDNPEAYPIAGFTWLLAYQEMADAKKAMAVARFLWWSTHDGQQYAKDLGYAPLPKDVVAKAEAKIRSITTAGKPILPQ
ncbi:MAG TPA: phosphate ABC transporter substrate-binding protein PstS [Candidatus Limnocylindria bacterium]|nr:phosphate ABC transporter substrate-binding protein PstS [Candidatus Limnocylindria bacterium]